MTEVELLRQALAYEAFVLQSYLDHGVVTKGGRALTERQINRLHQAAQGEVQAAYGHVPRVINNIARGEAGMVTLCSTSQPCLDWAHTHENVAESSFRANP